MIEKNKQPIPHRESSEKAAAIILFGEVLADVFPDKSVLGGAPYNVARHLQAFGQYPLLVSRTGDDTLHRELFAEMDRLGMDASGVQCDPAYPTGQVIVHMDGKGHRFEIIPDQAYDHIDSREAFEATGKYTPVMRYFGTLIQRSRESRLALDGLLDEGSSPRFLDINLREPWYDKEIIEHALSRADVLKINDDELLILAKLFKFPEAEDSEHGSRLLKQFGLDLLVVTCGASGAWAVSKDDAVIRVAGQKLGGELVDTVGAGDGFAAACILGILNGWTIKTMLERADAFARAICRMRGAAPQAADFYHSFVEEWQL